MALNPLVERMMREADGGNQGAPMGTVEDTEPPWMKELRRGLANGVSIIPGRPGSAGIGGAAGGGGPGWSSGDINIDRIMRTIRTLESGGNYTIATKVPGQTASGAYQFTDGTWGGYGGYARAMYAPPHIQDQKAAENIRNFLRQYNNYLPAVPIAWFLGHYKPGYENMGKPNSHNPAVRDYLAKWMRTYNSFG